MYSPKKKEVEASHFFVFYTFSDDLLEKTVCLKWSNHYYHKIVNDLESWIIFFSTIIIQVVFHVFFFLPGDMFVFPLDTFDNIPNQFIFMGFFSNKQNIMIIVMIIMTVLKKNQNFYHLSVWQTKKFPLDKLYWFEK